jgi:hypothetical protein
MLFFIVLKRRRRHPPAWLARDSARAAFAASVCIG